MKRILLVLTAALVVAAIVVATAAPAFANKVGGVGIPQGVTGQDSCSTHQLFNNLLNPQLHCGR